MNMDSNIVDPISRYQHCTIRAATPTITHDIYVGKYMHAQILHVENLTSVNERHRCITHSQIHWTIWFVYKRMHICVWRIFAQPRAHNKIRVHCWQCCTWQSNRACRFSHSRRRAGGTTWCNASCDVVAIHWDSFAQVRATCYWHTAF